MIEETLTFLCKRLNAHLVQRFPSDTEWVRLTQPASANGAAHAPSQDKILVALVNIARESAATRTHPRTMSDDLSALRMAPSLELSLDVVVAARFDDHYEDGLRLLSSAIGFFQAEPNFQRQSAPDLPKGLDRLTCEWVDMSMQELHNLWTVLGGHYLPSVVYKLRSVTVQEGRVTQDIPIVTGTDVDLSP